MLARFAWKAILVRAQPLLSTSRSAERPPMSEAAVIARNPLQGNSSSAGTVLIVDDEAEIRESLQTLLELEGFEVETANSGEDGIQRMGERPFDLVLLDLT